ncbi:MAG: hypothetical protein KOO61_06735 [Spirochaetales bacterium]|nr:hypothetical protein [Spirochaetales bacterium]
MSTVIRSRTAASVLFMIVFTSSVIAQDSGPAEPSLTEIIIPEFVLRVEELGVEEVEAVLPNQAELALGQIALPLPGADELAVSDIAFDAPLPAVAARSEGPSVFSTGRLGAGTANRVLGELSIYKLGADPRFRLGFAHEGLDGFQFNRAGTGYYAFTNTIDAWLSIQSENLELEGEAGFVESEKGLQDESAYNAVSVRATDVTAELVYKPDPLLTVTGDVDAGMATRLQTISGGADPPRDQEYVVEPAVEARIDIRSVDLIFSSSYYLRLLAGGAPATRQDLDFTAGFEAALPWSVVVAGHAGVHWDFASGLEYPWALSVRSLIGDALEVGASGGYQVERTRLSQLWEWEPLLAVADAVGTPVPTNNSVWYARADARWTGVLGLSLRSEVEFRTESAAFDLQPYDPASDEFPYLQRSMMSLTPSVQGAWQPSPVWQLEAGWKGRFIDGPAVEPSTVLDGAVRFSGRSGFFRADLEVVSELHPEPNVPWLGLSGTVTAGEGVELVVELSDLLSPLMDAGRPTHGSQVTPEYPFIEPGFVVTIFTRITL